MYHNVIGLVVLLRVSIVVDFVGPVKKRERGGGESGEIKGGKRKTTRSAGTMEDGAQCVRRVCQQ